MNIEKNNAYEQKKKYIMERIKNQKLFEELLEDYPKIRRQSFEKQLKAYIDRDAVRYKKRINRIKRILGNTMFDYKIQENLVNLVLSYSKHHEKTLNCFDDSIPFLLEKEEREKIKKFLEFIETIPATKEGEKIIKSCFDGQGYFSELCSEYYENNEFINNILYGLNELYEFFKGPFTWEMIRFGADKTIDKFDEIKNLQEFYKLFWSVENIK